MQTSRARVLVGVAGAWECGADDGEVHGVAIADGQRTHEHVLVFIRTKMLLHARCCCGTLHKRQKTHGVPKPHGLTEADAPADS
jgi:hypothetical protein